MFLVSQILFVLFNLVNINYTPLFPKLGGKPDHIRIPCSYLCQLTHKMLMFWLSATVFIRTRQKFKINVLIRTSQNFKSRTSNDFNKKLRFHKGPIWLRTSTSQSLYCLLLRGPFLLFAPRFFVCLYFVDLFPFNIFPFFL